MKLNTKKNPHISVIVVNNGPDAMAGSVLMRRKINGTSPPKLTATKVLAASSWRICTHESVGREKRGEI